MKPIIQTAALFISIFLISASCKKSANGTSTRSPTLTLNERTVFLTKATWNKVNEGTDTNRDGIVDIVSDHFKEPCNADDMASFSGSGTLLWLEGPIKCNSSGPDTYNLTWKFTDNGIFLLDKNLKIFKLTETDFQVYFEETSGANTVWQMMQFRH